MASTRRHAPSGVADRVAPAAGRGAAGHPASRRRALAVLGLAWLALGPTAAGARAGEPARLRLGELSLLDGARLPAGHFDGKVVVLMFWATWCPICAAEMPYLQGLHERFHDQGLRLLAVALDRERAPVVAFWQRGGYTMPVAMRSAELREQFGPIKGTPTFHVIDRRGVERLKHLGGLGKEAFEALIRGLL